MGMARCRMLDGGTPTNAFLMKTGEDRVVDGKVEYKY
jgi:hypothetical protein